MTAIAAPVRERKSLIALNIAHGDLSTLAAAIERILSDDALADTLRAGARQTFEARHMPAQNFQRLMEIYEFAQRHHKDSAVISTPER